VQHRLYEGGGRGELRMGGYTGMDVDTETEISEGGEEMTGRLNDAICFVLAKPATLCCSSLDHMHQTPST